MSIAIELLSNAAVHIKVVFDHSSADKSCQLQQCIDKLSIATVHRKVSICNSATKTDIKAINSNGVNMY